MLSNCAGRKVFPMGGDSGTREGGRAEGRVASLRSSPEPPASPPSPLLPTEDVVPIHDAPRCRAASASEGRTMGNLPADEEGSGRGCGLWGTSAQNNASNLPTDLFSSSRKVLNLGSVQLIASRSYLTLIGEGRKEAAGSSRGASQMRLDRSLFFRF